MSSRTVLWGARAGDVQAGSLEDALRRRNDERFYAGLRRVARDQAAVLARLPTATDAAAGLVRLGAFLDRYSVRVGDRG